MQGYMNKVLFVNLTTRQTSLYNWTEEDQKKYLGGKIMAAKILTDLLTPDVEPLSEENILVVSTGPFTNTGAPASSRFNVSSLSPLTGLLASSNCGGNFGIMLKKAGYDALIITGKSEDKIILEITENDILFHSADDLWGHTVDTIQAALPKRHGKLVIGPAGENLVKFAGLFSQERTAGRGGLGAVLGYKNLKAITAFGEKKTPINPKTKEYYKRWIQTLREHPLTGEQLPKFGTAGLLSIMQYRKILATKNFSENTYDDFEKVSGETLRENHLVKNRGCVTCPIQCGRQVKYKGELKKGPELETLGLFGPNLMNNDLEKIIEWNIELDHYGMDSISTAGVLAFAMELNEKGILKTDLEFSKTDNISEYIRKIAYREGIGNDMAEGVRYMSEKYGGHEFAIHSKGMELSAYEPRNAVGQGLGYAVSNRGGCHLNAGYIVLFEGLSMQMNPRSLKNKAELTIFSQDLMEVTSASGICLFTLQSMLPGFILEKSNHSITKMVNKLLTSNVAAGSVSILNGLKENQLRIHIPNIPHTKALKLLTGHEMNLGKYRLIGERGYNLERLFNIKRGLKIEHDQLPKRLTHEDQEAFVPLDKLKEKYYKKRGWDSDGIPTLKTLRKLGLE